MKVLAMICAVVCALGRTGMAQSSGETVKVHLDHAIVVSGVEIPAGDCTLRLVEEGGNGLLTVRSEFGPQAAALVNPVYDEGSHHAASVVLQHRGDTYFLDRIWLNGGEGVQVQTGQ